MRSSSRWIAAAILAATAFGCATTPPRSSTPSTPSAPSVAQTVGQSPAASEATQIASALREEAGIPGLAVAVGRDGEIAWSAGFGFADLELAVPAAPSQRFRLASVSKLVTAAIAARLVDQGRLDLDAPVRSFLPDYPEIGAAITPRQILGHLSGIRHYQPKDFVDDWDSKPFQSVAASLVTFRDDPLLHPPGTKELYSTYAFTLLAAILEVAGGASFPELVEREVAGPLGLETLTVDRFDVVLPGRADFYDRPNDAPRTVAEVRPAKPLNPSYKWAGGGLVASAEDLVRFGQAHFEPGYLKSERLDELFTKQRTQSGDELAVGLAWRIAKDDSGRTIHHHSGSQEGARSMLLLYPEEGLAVAVLSNLGGVPGDILPRAQQIAAPFLSARSGATPAVEEPK